MHFVSSHSWKNQGLTAHSLRKSEQQTPVSTPLLLTEEANLPPALPQITYCTRIFGHLSGNQYGALTPFSKVKTEQGCLGPKLCHFTAQTFRATPHPAPQKHFKLTLPGTQYRQHVTQGCFYPKELEVEEHDPLSWW